MVTETKSNPMNQIVWSNYKHTSKAHSSRCLFCYGLIRLVGNQWRHTFAEDGAKCITPRPIEENR